MDHHLELTVLLLTPTFTLALLQRHQIIDSECIFCPIVVLHPDGGLLRTAFSELHVVALPTEIAVSPRHRHLDAAATAVATAFEILWRTVRVVDILHELVYFDGLFLVVLLETLEGTDPSFLDELVVAGELPSDLIVGVVRGEVVLDVHGTVADIFLLHHMLGDELYGEEGGIEVELVDVEDVDDIDGALRQLMGHFQCFDVACISERGTIEELGDVGIVVEFGPLDDQQSSVGGDPHWIELLLLRLFLVTTLDSSNLSGSPS